MHVLCVFIIFVRYYLLFADDVDCNYLYSYLMVSGRFLACHTDGMGSIPGLTTKSKTRFSSYCGD